MSDDENDDVDEPYRMHCNLGDLELTVKGPDEQWVKETFEATWTDRLDEAAEMKEALREADRITQ